MVKSNDEMTEKQKRYDNLCGESLATYKSKNADYGDSYALLRKDFPELIVIHLQEKVNRLKRLFHAEAKVDESKRDTLMDIVGYALMELVEMDDDENEH